MMRMRRGLGKHPGVCIGSRSKGRATGEGDTIVTLPLLVVILCWRRTPACSEAPPTPLTSTGLFEWQYLSVSCPLNRSVSCGRMSDGCT
jgi:hypothetical protein